MWWYNTFKNDFVILCSGAWLPFQDPKAEEDRTLVVLIERIDSEAIHVELNSTDYERKESNLRRILRENFFDLEVALNSWHSWVQWRHENNADGITGEIFKLEGVVVC